MNFAVTNKNVHHVHFMYVHKQGNVVVKVKQPFPYEENVEMSE